MKNNRILIWDTETYGMRLAGDRARIIALVGKWLGESKLYTYRIDQYPLYKKDPTNDVNMCKEFEKLYVQADMTVAHYGKGFDLPEMNTRRAMHNLGPLPKAKMYDTWYVLKKTFNLSSNSLKNALDTFDLGVKKMQVPWHVWDKAGAGHKASMDTIVARCKSDVLGLEQLFLKIRPWMPQYMPNVHKVLDNGTCKICGGDRLWKKGREVKQKKWFQTYQCRSCGSYQVGGEIK